MILTSKLCFLNQLIHHLPLEDIRNANYYILDCRSPSGNASLVDQVEYDEETGTMVPVKDTPGIFSALSKYKVFYSTDELDPTSLSTQLLTGIKSYSSDPIENFLKRLSTTASMISIYDFLYLNKTDGLKILIYYNPTYAAVYGHHVAKFLARNYGSDITFLDAVSRGPAAKEKYRLQHPNVSMDDLDRMFPEKYGQSFFPGDTERAKKVLSDILDANIVINIRQMLTAFGPEESTNNLIAYLAPLSDFKSIIKVYELLFPNNPLPPGNYTVDQIKEIIIGKATESMSSDTSIMNNLYTVNDFDFKNYFDEED